MGQAMAFRENIRAFRENDYGLENALAKYVRNRWPDKTIPHVIHHFGLSESVASKVVYAEASKSAINRILLRRDGLEIIIECACDVAGTSLRNLITKKAEEAAREHAQAQALARAFEPLDPYHTEPASMVRWPDKPSGRLGSEVAGRREISDGSIELDSFAPETRGAG